MDKTPKLGERKFLAQRFFQIGVFLAILFLLTLAPNVQAEKWNVSTQAEFDLGTYINTSYNNTTGAFFVSLNETNFTGNYTSKVFDSTATSSWDNLTWVEGIPYGEELPDEQTIETSLGGANMTKNVLLFHLNNDVGLGESTTHFYDSSVVGNNGSCSTNCPAYTIYGEFGNASVFTPSDYITVADNETLDFGASDDFSISLWLNTTSTARQFLVSKYAGGGAAGYYFDISEPSTGLKGHLHAALYGTGGTGASPNAATGNVSDGKWHHVVYTKNSTADKVYLYVDGHLVNNTTDTTTGGHVNAQPLYIGDYVVGSIPFNGTIDEFAIYNRTLDPSEILDHYKRGALRLNITVRSCIVSDCSGTDWNETFENSSWGNLSNVSNNRYFQFVAKFLTYNETFTPELYNVTINYTIVSTISSIRAQKFNISAYNFSSSNYIVAVDQQFNTTEDNINVTLLTSFNLEKISGGGTNTVSGRIFINDSLIVEEDLRTISGLNDEGAVGFRAVIFNVTKGSHNLTVEFKRSGTGIIEVNDIDMVLMKFSTEGNGKVRGNVTNSTYLHSSTDFRAGLNFSVNKTVSSMTYIIVKQTVNQSSAVAGTLTYKFNHTDSNNTSTLWQRYLSGNTDVGSISGIWLDSFNRTGDLNYTIDSKNTQGDTTSNTSVFDIDLTDDLSQYIPCFNISNSSTDITNTLTYSAGVHKVASQQVKVQSGTSYFLAMTTTFKSTSGAQTPRYFINSSNSTVGNCTAQKHRYLSGNKDIGNAFIYTTCDNLAVDSLYEFNLFVEVPTGETLVQLDEFLGGFETTSFTIATAPDFALDADNDGFNETVDCDDLNATRIPLLNGSDTIIDHTVEVCTNFYNNTRVIPNESGITINFNFSTLWNGTYAINLSNVANLTMTDVNITQYNYAILANNTNNSILANSSLDNQNITLNSTLNGTLFLRNTTYTVDKILFETGSTDTLIPQWYARIQTRDIYVGKPIENANATLKNINLTRIFTLLTDSNGNTLFKVINESERNSTYTLQFNNYTAGAEKQSEWNYNQKNLSINSSQTIILYLDKYPGIKPGGPGQHGIPIRCAFNETWFNNTCCLDVNLNNICDSLEKKVAVNVTEEGEVKDFFEDLKRQTAEKAPAFVVIIIGAVCTVFATKYLS